MKINVDLQCVNICGTGIAEFAKSRIAYLEAQSDVSLYGFLSKARHGKGLDLFRKYSFPIKIGYLPIRLLYSRFIKKALPISYEWLCGNKADINLYFTWNIKRVRHHGITIATIHDLIALRTEMETNKIVENQINDITYSLKHCDYILTVSESSKKDIVYEFNYPSDKISVVPNGIDFNSYNKKVPSERLKHIREKYGLPSKFILYLGGIRKHKNIERLVTAYSILPKELKSEYHLVITKGTPTLKELAKNLGIAENVIFTQFIDEDDKAGMYQLASLYAYISLYEGFGLPVVEAQAAGTPVITSNISSLPEVVGASALCVNPENVEEISLGIQRILKDYNLRSDLIEKGYINAKRYSKENAGKILYNTLVSIIKKTKKS